MEAIQLATIKEIAALAGVSPSTVSIVLSGKAKERRISEGTCKKVLDAAKQLDYHPNLSARRLRSSTARNVFMIAVFWVYDFRANYMVRFFRGLQKAVLDSDRKFEISIHPYRIGLLHEVAAPRIMSMYDAAIICNVSDEDMEFLEKTDFNIPIVLYNRYSKKYPTVYVDDKKLGQLPAQVFASRGHRLAAIFSSTAVFSGMSIRVQSFIEEAQKYGLNNVNYIVENSMMGGYEGARQLSYWSEMPDCLFCISDAIALGALRAFHEKKIKVPEDIEIISIGNDDIEREEYSFPSLSVAHVPIENMAEACFNLISSMLIDKTDKPSSIELPVRYIQRESCGNLILNNLKHLNKK